MEHGYALVHAPRRALAAKRRFASSVAVVGCVLGLAACGGGNPSATSGTTTTTAAGGGGTTTSTTSGVSSATVKAHLLSLSDLPAGWSVNNTGTSTTTSGLASSQCLAGLAKPPKGEVEATASFEHGNFPVLEELLASGPGADAAYTTVANALAACKSVTLSAQGKTLKGTIGQMSFPSVGTESVAYSLGFTITTVNVGFDLVLFKAGGYDGLVGYADLGTPNITTAEAFAKEAVAKAEGQSVTPPSTVAT